MDDRSRERGCTLIRDLRLLRFLRLLRRLRPPVLVGAAGALLGWLIAEGPITRDLIEPVELATLDWRMRSAAIPNTQPDEIVLILFDEASAAQWPYLSPVPRAYLAQLVDIVSRSGARTIALDVFLDRLYPDPAPTEPDSADAALRQALERAGNVVLVARTANAGDGRVATLPHAYFSDAARAVAVADLPVPHETVRDAVLVVNTDDGPVAGLGLALYAMHTGLDLDSLVSAAATLGELHLPALPRGRTPLIRGQTAIAPLAFRGPPSRPGRDTGAFTVLASSNVIEFADYIPEEWFAGRTVLIGSGFHSDDRFRTAFFGHTGADGIPAGWMFGAEVHATMVHGLMAGTIPAPVQKPLAAGLMLGCCILVVAMTSAHGVVRGAVVTVLLTLTLASLAWYAFAAHAIVVSVVTPAIALGMTFAQATAYTALVEGRDKRRIRSAFARYVAPEVVAELVADPSRLRLGGEKREITILFADLVGFTHLSETEQPERVVTLLNSYLDEMTHIILEEGGTLDKFIGDAVMGLFGAPRTCSDHAQRACRAALRMHERLVDLNRTWSQGGWPTLRMRVGLNTGTAVVGNIGGRERFDYTALGDAVNVAARLESACRTYDVGIMASAATASAAGPETLTRELDTIVLYGRDEPLTVHQLVGRTSASSATQVRGLRLFGEGLDLYRRRYFRLADEAFRAAADALPGDGPTALYLQRCRGYRSAPPPATWSHIARMQVK